MGLFRSIFPSASRTDKICGVSAIVNHRCQWQTCSNLSTASHIIANRAVDEENGQVENVKVSDSERNSGQKEDSNTCHWSLLTA